MIYITRDTILEVIRHAELGSASIKRLQEIFMKITTQLSRVGLKAFFNLPFLSFHFYFCLCAERKAVCRGLKQVPGCER